MDEMQRYATVKQFAKEQNIFGESALRWMIFHKEKNGFKPAFKKVGKKVLIDKPTFYSLVANETKTAA